MASSVFQILQKRKISLTILVGLFLLYHSLFNSFTGQILFDRVFVQLVRGEIKGNVQKFSPLYGIRIQDITVHASSEWGSEPLLVLKRFEFSYNLPYLFFGRLKLSRIALEDLELNLVQKGKVWNIATIFPSSKATTEPPPAAPSDPLTQIRTYFPVSAFLRFELKNINVRILSNNGAKSYSAGLEGLEFALELDTKRFTKIPFDLTVLQLIDDFQFRLNPEKQIRLRFEDSSRSLDHPLRFTWIWDRGNVRETFRSKLDVGSERIPLRLRNRLVAPFGFSFKYDLEYSPDSKELMLGNLQFKVNDDVWLEGGGKISGFGDESQLVNVALQKSKIRLAPVSDFLQSLGFAGISMQGEASLAPVLFEGTSKDLRVIGEIKANGLNLRIAGRTHRIPELYLDWDARLYPSTNQAVTGPNPLPWIGILDIKKLKVLYNDATLLGTIFYSGDPKVRERALSLDLKLDRFSLAPYSPGLAGLLSVDLGVRGADFSSLDLNLKMKAKGFRFAYGRGNSGNILLDGKLKGILRFPDKPWELREIHISPLSMGISSPEGTEAFSLESGGKVRLGESLSADLNNAKLKANLDDLLPLLPLVLRESLMPVRSQLGANVGLSGDLSYSKIASVQEIKGGFGLLVPALEIKDGKLKVSVMIDGSPANKIHLKQLDLSAFAGKLSFQSSGTLSRPKQDEAPPSVGPFAPDLSGSFRLLSKEDAYLIKGLTFRGDLSLGFRWVGSMISGNFSSKESGLYISNRLCPSPECKLYRIDGLNASVPFQHDVSMRETRNLIEGDKRKFVMNYGRLPEPNFTIREIVGTHPSLKGLPFEYVKPKGGSPGLSANINYSENYLRMDFLKVYTLDGEVLGKDVIINVGAGTPEKMEYALALRVKDIDLKQLLPNRSRSKIDDGKIKADVNLWGRNLGDPIPNLNLFFSVYQIGRDFGKSAINIFAPSNLLTDFIYTSYAVDKIELELSKGLVYAVILFKRSVLGTFVNLENNQVSQQRMPLANFLKRAQSEIETYNK
ncbi:hypothetical protein LEP1GSC050_2188 [Leptospira broomii serovar Hurstbridge str. 5399]|uniref:Uncharacterized protein n=1 Tax=Leptospira broomii serovar Hurstbridge str. 5399 TaxID=1049789 RepID=T0FB00_9LEPT|nr:PRC-barrel domain-containing protein [Leptospira broomii]EQA44747.1 hypothetical protein LEP1GSC050_2188 [Leptospira broomii serovar Hurstbridge str. 5399]